MSTQIHSTAILHPSAELGEDVCLGPYTIIHEQTRIGDGCRIDAFAQIKPYTDLGRNNHVFSYACLGEIPQDLKFQGEISRLEIGDENNIREYCTLNRRTGEGGGITRIGDGCLLMAYSHVAHDCRLGDKVIMANCATLAGHVQIGDHAIIGGLSAVHQFVRIGDMAFVGGKTGAAQDVPPYTLVAGERAKLEGLNLVGLRRHKLPKEEISALKKALRLIWYSSLTREEAVEKIFAADEL
ncbi:MAG: acyl-ACP--UDP-N-acetylglucosamine O-acyltransferase, partial [Desulfonatronovibrionaceae bacterium]